MFAIDDQRKPVAKAPVHSVDIPNGTFFFGDVEWRWTFGYAPITTSGLWVKCDNHLIKLEPPYSPLLGAGKNGKSNVIVKNYEPVEAHQQRKEHIWCDSCGSVVPLIRDYMPADELRNIHAATDLLCGVCRAIIATLHHLDDRGESTPRARTQTN